MGDASKLVRYILFCCPLDDYNEDFVNKKAQEKHVSINGDK